MEKQHRLSLPKGQCANLNVSQFSNIVRVNLYTMCHTTFLTTPESQLKRLESKM